MATEIDLEWFQERKLVLPPGLSFDDCQLLYNHISKMERNAGFWLGDLCRYVQRTHPEKFSQLVDATGFAKHTVQNAMSIADAFEPSRRREGVTFAHHDAVSGLEPEQQDELLERAEVEEMSVAELRARARHLRVVAEPNPERTCWTMACYSHVEPEEGPTIAVAPGHTDVDRGWLNRWLADHAGHDVRLVDPASTGAEQTCPSCGYQWRQGAGPRSGPSAKVG